MIIKYAVAVFLTLINLTCFSQVFEYPLSPKKPVSDTFFSQVVTENFRWLEDVNNETVKKWVKDQNTFTSKFLKNHGNIFTTEEEIELRNRIFYNIPFKEGKYFFQYTYNQRLAPTASLYYKTALNDEATLLVSPSEISVKDKIEIRNFSVSKDNKYLAYAYSRNGSDLNEIRVVKLSNAANKKDVLKDVKFSGISWYGNGFYYARYPHVSQFDPTLGEQIYYHTLGTSQDEDKLIYTKAPSSSAMLLVSVTSDEKHLFIKEADKVLDEYTVLYKSLKDSSDTLKSILKGSAAQISILDSYGDDVYFTATYKNTNGIMIAKFKPDDALKWDAIVEELEDAVTVECKLIKEGILTVIKSDLREYIIIYNLQGEIKKIIKTPVGYRTDGFSGDINEEELLFYLTSYTSPSAPFLLSLKDYSFKGAKEKTRITFEFQDFENEKTEYPSRDGTMIPMLLVSKKGMKKDGTHPALLTAYGGFGIIDRPSFKPGLVYFLENGGMYAEAYIRGGGEKGKKWAAAGRGENKQTSFNDFVDAAEFLIKNKYTSAEHLGITGGSNGGLVVAEAAMQKPELFKAVIPRVGVFDMIRFEKFTIGNHHIKEYGTVTDSVSFKRLLSYSPLHQIDSTKIYPAWLIITGEYDDRVPPFHSYKFAAALQSLQQSNPVLLRTISQAGHHGDNTWDGLLKRNAEMYSFLLHFLK